MRDVRIQPAAAPSSPPMDAEEVIHESARTRVSRHGGAVQKEYLGPDAGARQRREAEMLARVAHLEGVVQFAGGRQPPHMLVLQDCGVVRLADLLAAGPLDRSDALDIALRVAGALGAVHRCGVLHRDVNPANIVLSHDGVATLIDFDLACLAHEATSEDGWIAGTLGYVAPEQTGRTRRTVDQRADLYALGATLYEMATGRPPFDAHDPLQLVHDHLVREPVSPSHLDAGVPKALSAIILRLLAKLPEQRYHGAEGLLHDLSRLQENLARGDEEPFELGQADFAVRLVPPAHVVGRAVEVAQLRASLEAACVSDCRTLVVEGVAGVGKTVLIRELRPLAAAAGGWFVQGKFGQQHGHEDAAGGFAQVLRGVARLLLSLGAQQLADERARLLERLAGSIALLTAVVPELDAVFGEQPPLAEADSRQADVRLQQAIADLLHAVAQPGRPVVVFLDDLQWAGAQAVRTFERVMLEEGPRGLLLVGAVRPAHASGGMAQDRLGPWEEHAGRCVQIVLRNLVPDDVNALAAAMLRMPTQTCRDLSASIFLLTQGNPFEVVELVNALRGDGVLIAGVRGWQWDEDAVRRFVGRSNVADLLSQRIARLPETSRELLEAMCCLGGAVGEGLLGTALALPEGELQSALAPALEDGLLLADVQAGHWSVHFRHDRVQETVQLQFDVARRQQRHLALARRMAAQPAFSAHAAQQYLACLEELAAAGDRAEHRQAARLFHASAARLAAGADYGLAQRFLDAASRLLSGLDDAQDLALRRDLDTMRHTALYSLGRVAAADALWASIEAAQGSDALQLVEPAGVQMRSLYVRGRTAEAKELGLRLLAQLGLDARRGAAGDDLDARLDALPAWVAEDRLRDPLQRPQIREPSLLAIAKLINRLARPSYILSDQRTFVWMLLECQRLWAAHGPCADLVAALGRASAFLVTSRQDYRTAYELARHVLKVGEALGWEPQTSEARFLFAASAAHWFEPLETTLEEAVRACEGIRAGGDASYAGYAHIGVIGALLDLAPTIDACLAETEAGIAAAERAGNFHSAAMETPQRQMLRAFQAGTRPGSFDDAGFDEGEFLARVGQLAGVRCVLHECKAMYAMVMGDAQALLENATRGQSLLGNLAGYHMAVVAHVLSAIARAWQVRGGRCDRDARAVALAQLQASRQWLQARASDQPRNYVQSLRLVEAEEAWALGDRWGAAIAFDEAAAAADAAPRPWRRAFILERAGMFQLAEGLRRTGRDYLAQALEAYRRWGATAKVAQLRRDYPFLAHASHAGLDAVPVLASVSSRFSADALDLMGVLRASQALSSETSLAQLTARVEEVLSAMSGATRVLVIQRDEEGGWRVAPSPGKEPVANTEAPGRPEFPLSVIRYAERTRADLVVDDACSDDRFSSDPYFAGVRACSLFISPVASQGSLRAMLLLENATGPAAFNAQRLDAVKLVAGQLAVSLANAQLYECLEARVRARTRDLERAQSQLLEAARRAGKAEIAANVLHNVGNVLNSVNVSANMARRTLQDSRRDGVGKVARLLEAQGADLARFLADGSKGSLLTAYLREVDAALGNEQASALEDIDRVLRSVEHIIYVVTMQQSHAGPTNVLEITEPGELLNEALRLSADALSRHGATVLLQCDGAPALAMDKQRVLQILVNLIANAAQATVLLPRQARQVHVASELMQGEGGGRLRLRVRDAGEGIAPENMRSIFAHGFTTRPDGHGFGLHSSAVAAMEMGGTLTVHSDGPGRGATFTLELPLP